ncbi:MAG: beta-ketoacyl synthase N-terminal-like domain-containing protein, partial [Pseudomonadota bacterium]
MSSNASIAVIGMGCVYPGALNPETLWENILAGRRYFRISPDERLPNQYYFDPDPEVLGKTYCNRMAVIDGWSFDPIKWKIPPITYNQSEIVHWLSLHTASEALKAAKIDFDKTDKRRVGVVLGNSGIGEFHRSYLLRNRWPFVERAMRRALGKTYSGKDSDALVEAVRHYYESPFPELREDHLSGNMANVIAGRIANYYDFRSASYTVDGACASSLLAVINACGHLESGDMDVALAGGVDISLDPLEMVGFAKTQALAKQDIRPYDDQAQGIQTGEGCGIVVLSTEAYARQQGYHIHALIKGWGISSDGSGGITQPKKEGQKYALEKTYQKAGYDISTVGYIEGHGTGTPVGDPVEIKALMESQAEVKSENTCHIGSIKANIGHTKAAAGVAGLIKATMALERKILPPHVTWRKPNPAFGTPLTTLRPSQGGPWKSSAIRRASISAFGFGGANTHVTLQEMEPEKAAMASELELIGSHQESELILLSARSPRELKEKAERLLPVAQRICQAELIDLSAALAKAGHNGKFRAALISETPWQLANQLHRLINRLSEGLTLDEIHTPQEGLNTAEARD